jgi:hypothetical protein
MPICALMSQGTTGRTAMNIDFDIDVADLTDEIVGEHSFGYAVDERVDERLGDRFADLLHTHLDDDALPSDLVRDHMLIDTVNEHLTELLDSLPTDSDSRCSLGRSFERAVLRVVGNVLDGDALRTRDGLSLDDKLAFAIGRITARGEQTSEPPVESPSSYPTPRTAVVLLLSSEQDDGGRPLVKVFDSADDAYTWASATGRHGHLQHTDAR